MKILLVILVIGAINSNACEFESAYEVASEQVAFVNALKAATKVDNKKRISELIAYPLSISLENGELLRLETEADFIKNYEVIFNSNVKEAILKQEIEALFFTWRGLMVGHGHVWITGVISDGDITTYWITTINTDAPPVTECHPSG